MAKADWGAHQGTIGPERNSRGKRTVLKIDFATTFITPVVLFVILYSFTSLWDSFVFGMPVLFFLLMILSDFFILHVFARNISPIEVYTGGIFTPTENPLRLRTRVFIPVSSIKAVELCRIVYPSQAANQTPASQSYLALVLANGKKDKIAFRDTDILVEGALLISHTYGIELRQDAHSLPSGSS